MRHRKAPSKQSEQAGALRREWASAYRNCKEEEEGYWLAVEGRLPADLHGTLYRCYNPAP